MLPTLHPRVKICCIASIEEAKTAIAYGASALGFVSAMPSGPGVISEEKIAEIVSAVPPPIATFLLTSKQDAPSIIRQQKKCRTNTIQLCDRIVTGVYQQLRDALPGVALVQVIHVNGRDSIDEAIATAPFVDALLLDSGNEKSRVKELGGTGRVHDWSISKAIRESVDKPIFLAGGLNGENVARAISEVAPFGLDLCSGVRTNGMLDKMKLTRFFGGIRSPGSHPVMEN
jgi:phosphoribosylanthranilate isomerase